MFLKPICAIQIALAWMIRIEEELEVMRRKKKKKKKSSYPPSSCKPFPPLEKKTDTQTRVTSKPFVQSPVTASGQPEEPKQYEAVL